MSGLTMKQAAICTKLVEDLREAAADIRGTVAEINELVGEKLTPAVKTYNAILDEAESLRAEVYRAMRDYYDSKSVKWQNSKAGISFVSRMDVWHDADFSGISFPDDIEPDDMSHATDLEGLASETE
jgi:hypothetical protein